MQPIMNNTLTSNNSQHIVRRNNFHRKTSAEIISEAKNMLAGGGARLVSTRRPITPREPRRQLYGKLAPPGRPPSAFSLRYLQFESRALPTIGSIQHQQQLQQRNDDHGTNTSTSSNDIVDSTFIRSVSMGKLYDNSSSNGTNQHETNNNNNNRPLGNKLPALLLPPQQITGSLDDLSEEMPPRKEFRIPKSDVIVYGCNTKDSTSHQQKASTTNSKGRQDKSLEEKKSKSQITQKNRLQRNNDLLAQSSTETLLDMLKAHTGIKECSEETILHINGILTELYTRVKGARGEWRCAVLGALYGLVECVSPKVLLSVARVVLVLRVTGSNLTGACKLVFKIARHETNDNLFVDSDVPELLIDGLGRANPLEEPEACIYGYGAVRFLANAMVCIPKDAKNTNSAKTRQRTIAQRLVRHGAVQLMVLHLQIFNETGATKKLTGQPLHALFQLSGALRALAKTPTSANSDLDTPQSLYSISKDSNCPEIQEPFEEQDFELHLACLHLVRAAEVCMTEAEVQGNIIRTISVLSENAACCEVLSEATARLGILLGSCGNGATEKQSSVLIRLGYILGNIMARHDSARSQFYNNDVAMEYLMSNLVYYSNKPFTVSHTTTDTVAEILVKLIRVIANMSVNDEVGHGLGLKADLGIVLLTILLASNNMKDKLSAEIEELLLATLGALHNLSFYQSVTTEEHRQPPSSMTERLGDISSTLCKTLVNSPIIAQTEAARVLGNMTRIPIARKAFCGCGGLKVLVKNLESENNELTATSCGVLVNLLGDWERRAPFRELKGPQLLRDVLQRSALEEDWILAGIVCQALWNYLIDSSNIIGALGEDEADYIAGELAEYLDEDRLFNGETPDQLWEQFAIVATDLLERIQSSINYSNSPCASSSEEDVAAGRIGNSWGGEHFKTWLQENN